MQRKRGIYVLVFMGFQTKCRELSESTAVSTCEEPLKETPQEAKREELP